MKLVCPREYTFVCDPSVSRLMEFWCAFLRLVPNLSLNKTLALSGAIRPFPVYSVLCRISVGLSLVVLMGIVLLFPPFDLIVGYRLLF